MKYVLFLLIIFSTLTYSQELDCTVTVNTDNVSNYYKDNLSNFKNLISDYMNKTRFTNQDWNDEKISCGISIFILSASNDINYTAQAVVTSYRPIYKSSQTSLMLSINDNNWSFTYQKGEALSANQTNFDPLKSFLDYYANVIIGFYVDSWEKLGGTPYFNKAINIVSLGSSSQFSVGWASNSGSYTRGGLVSDLLNDKYRPFRDAIYDYYLGLDYYQVNPKVGEDKMVELITTLQKIQDQIDFNSVLIKTFFDAKSGEIVQYLKDYPDKTIFTTLKKIDPSHTSKYNSAGF
jgi:Domain of unknown function (DUF4835)